MTTQPAADRAREARELLAAEFRADRYEDAALRVERGGMMHPADKAALRAIEAALSRSPSAGVGEALDNPAVKSSVNFLIQRFVNAPCDHKAVSECVRCKAIFLAKSVREALKSPPEQQR